MTRIERYHHLAKAACGLAIAGSLSLASVTRAVDLTFGMPVVTGAGVGTTALFSNIGTQNGADIDMLATITSQNTSQVHEFTVTGDDHKFILMGSGNRTVTIRYEFFESGTTNPLAIEQMVWAIDDLDHYSSRTESLAVTGTSSYTLNDPTTVVATESGGTYTFTGGANHDTGDPESAVAMLFVNKSELTVTYSVLAGGASQAGFHHDGDGDFAFAAPQIHWVAPYLKYTFNLQNDENDAVTMDFRDTLPEGVAWDTGFTPVSSEGLTVASEAIAFSDGDRTITIDAMTLPPGASTLELRTQSVVTGGVFANEAMLSVDEDSEFPPLDLPSSSSIEMEGPPPGAVIVDGN